MIDFPIVELDLIGVWINRWLALFVLIFGLLGNLLNLLTFLCQTSLKQSVSLYFIIISLNNLVLFVIGLTSRVIIDGFQVKVLGDDSNAFCKIRTYLVYSLFSISSWLLVFATVDRYYSTSTSATKRQYVCSIQLARKCVFITIVGCLLTHGHILVFYNYFYLLNPYDEYELTCAVQSIVYNFFFAFFILIFYSLLPPILIGILGLLTLHNIRISRRNINPTNVATNNNTRDRNQLIKILSLQIITLIIFTIPHSIYWIYIGFNSSNGTESKSNLARQYERFFLHVVRLLLYINYGSSFFIQIAFSKTFRCEFLKTLQIIKRRFIRCWRKRIFPRFFLSFENE